MGTASCIVAEPANSAPSPSILEDLEAGEAPVLLTDLPGQPFAVRPKGKRQHPSTVFRWALDGVRGHKLVTLRYPAGLVTTRSAYLRFVRRLTGPSAVPHEQSIPADQRRRERTLATLRAARIAC